MEELFHPLDQRARVLHDLAGSGGVDREGAFVVGLLPERLKARILPVGVRRELAGADEMESQEVRDALVGAGASPAAQHRARAKWKAA